MESFGSLEGLYAPDHNTILLGALRPRGRRAFTCAHELGHHVAGDGLCVQELLADGSPVEEVEEREFVANRFAAALLMPKMAVMSAFAKRRWRVNTATPAQVYTIAGYLGVGYSTLVNYLLDVLQVIPFALAAALRKLRPQSIRRSLAGDGANGGLIVVDEHWSGRPVDVEVGDLVSLPPSTLCDGTFVRRASTTTMFVEAPGTCLLRRAGWRAELRAMRSPYIGLADYRFLGEEHG